MPKSFEPFLVAKCYTELMAGMFVQTLRSVQLAVLIILLLSSFAGLANPYA